MQAFVIYTVPLVAKINILSWGVNRAPVLLQFTEKDV